APRDGNRLPFLKLADIHFGGSQSQNIGRRIERIDQRPCYRGRPYQAHRARGQVEEIAARLSFCAGPGVRCVCHWISDPLVVIATRRSEEHTSELQSRENLVCRLLLEKKKK